jgi:hypothetical protein
VTLSREHADASSCRQQRGLVLDLHQDLAAQDVEELLRLLVMVTNLGSAWRHEFLDYGELVIADQIPGIAIVSPAIVLGVATVHRAGLSGCGWDIVRHAFRLLTTSVTLWP